MRLSDPGACWVSSSSVLAAKDGSYVGLRRDHRVVSGADRSLGPIQSEEDLLAAATLIWEARHAQSPRDPVRFFRRCEGRGSSTASPIQFPGVHCSGA